MSKRKLAVGALAVVAVVVAASAAGARLSGTASTTYAINAKLDIKHEVPAPKDAKNAKGVLSAKLVVAGKKSSFVWKMSFSGLSGRAIASHLHYGVAGKAGPIVLPLCVPCASSPANGSYTGAYVANATFVKAILHGGMYVNVHTKLNPKGEIRGQIKATSAG